MRSPGCALAAATGHCLLTTLRWNKDTKYAVEGPLRGQNVRLRLRPESGGKSSSDHYGLDIEVIPAWHDDVIGKTAAVGLKFHLFDNGKEVGIVGYTGDTGVYGLKIPDKAPARSPGSLVSQFSDCDVLIAHLGDVRLRELSSRMKIIGHGWQFPGSGQSQANVSGSKSLHPLTALLRGYFQDVEARSLVFPGMVREFFYFLLSLDLVRNDALSMKLGPLSQKTSALSVADWLGRYIGQKEAPYQFSNNKDTMLSWLSQHDWGLNNDLEALLGDAWAQSEKFKGDLDSQQACVLLEFLVLSAAPLWQYEHHLGVFGVHQLFTAMRKRDVSGRHERVFVVGELPEELPSYRHLIARLLNASAGQQSAVRAFTGDIGLHISLVPKKKRNKRNVPRVQPKIRCVCCNHNNEIVCRKMNCHPPSKMREMSLMRLRGAMVYLCTEKDHYPESGVFLSRPEVRSV